jgi:hypothetical protein
MTLGCGARILQLDDPVLERMTRPIAMRIYLLVSDPLQGAVNRDAVELGESPFAMKRDLENTRSHTPYRPRQTMKEEKCALGPLTLIGAVQKKT